MSLANSSFSFRELDERAGLPKGSAFRAFKKIESELNPEVDFALLRHGQHDAEIESLRQQNRIYRNSVNIVLLSDAAAARVLKTLAQTDVPDIG